jgi:hypothetical protein
MNQNNPQSRKQADGSAHDATSNHATGDKTPTGIGSEAAEGIHGMGAHIQGERSSLDDRDVGRSFRAGAERSGSEPLLGRTWVHESGYGGKGGEPRTSSDERESSERISAVGHTDHTDHTEAISNSGGDANVDARRSPFYEWLDNAAIRALVDRSLELSAGERLMLIKGLVPGLVEEVGLVQFQAFLAEIAIKACRFQEAVDHPGAGRAARTTPGEELGGPTPTGHEHLPTARDPDHRGAREAERAIENKLWTRTEHEPHPDTDR